MGKYIRKNTRENKADSKLKQLIAKLQERNVEDAADAADTGCAAVSEPEEEDLEEEEVIHPEASQVAVPTEADLTPILAPYLEKISLLEGNLSKIQEKEQVRLEKEEARRLEKEHRRLEKEAMKKAEVERVSKLEALLSELNEDYQTRKQRVAHHATIVSNKENSLRQSTGIKW